MGTGWQAAATCQGMSRIRHPPGPESVHRHPAAWSWSAYRPPGTASTSMRTRCGTEGVMNVAVGGGGAWVVAPHGAAWVPSDRVHDAEQLHGFPWTLPRAPRPLPPGHGAPSSAPPRGRGADVWLLSMRHPSASWTRTVVIAPRQVDANPPSPRSALSNRYRTSATPAAGASMSMSEHSVVIRTAEPGPLRAARRSAADTQRSAALPRNRNAGDSEQRPPTAVGSGPDPSSRKRIGRARHTVSDRRGAGLRLPRGAAR